MPHDVQVRTDGVLTVHLAALNRHVFGSDIDGAEWAKRMIPGKSWVLTTTHGFLIAHRRGQRDVNVWLGGVVSEVRQSGHFRALVHRLVDEVGWLSRLTMTTRPVAFPVMFGILSTFAHRCDGPEDATTGKARFRVPAVTVLIALRRRTAAVLLLSLGACSAVIVCGGGKPRSAALLGLGCSSVTLSAGLALCCKVRKIDS